MNFSVQRTLFAYALCFFATQLSSMEDTKVPTAITVVPERPILKANLYIDPGMTFVAYASTEYHKKLTEIGIPSCMQNPLMPIFVTIKDEKDGEWVDWTRTVPGSIKGFEYQQYNGQDIDMATQDARVRQKKFPDHIPAVYLCRATTGTILSFTIHNYPVQLLCCDHLKTSFKETYDFFMNSFKNGSFICLSDRVYIPKISSFFSHTVEDSTPELVEHGMLEEIENGTLTLLNHGKKGFVSMQKLIRELMGKKAEVILLLWPFCRGI